jgi:hypothetical protein
LDVASLIGILGQSDNQTSDQGFFTQINLALALSKLAFIWTVEATSVEQQHIQ